MDVLQTGMPTLSQSSATNYRRAKVAVRVQRRSPLFSLVVKSYVTSLATIGMRNVLVQAGTRDYQAHLSALRKRVDELPSRSDSMGLERPNTRALDATRKVLGALRAIRTKPERVVPSAEGGASVVFYANGRRATIESLNTGEVIASIHGKREPWEVNDRNLFSTLAQIRAHLEG